MAYDSTRQRTVLFGGYVGGSPDNTTWEWDGANWAQMASSGPSPRTHHPMVYDSARGVAVLFGGHLVPGVELNDTWEWNGVTWTQRFPATVPAVRHIHAMAYDIVRGRVVLFGGSSQGQRLSDTWEWDGTDWALKSTSGPAPRNPGALAFDSFRGKTVLFGGEVGSSQVGDTWEWDGTTWLQRATTGPLPRARPAMVFDTSRGRIVLFGGWSASSGYFGDTWEWDGNTWIQKLAGPTARFYHSMAFDMSRGRAVLFGGDDGSGIILGDTWEYGTSSAGQPIWRFTDIDVPNSAQAQPDIAVAADGTVHVAYFFGDEVRYARRPPGEDFTNQIAVSNANGAEKLSLAVDANGNPRIAWQTPGTPNNPPVQYVEFVNSAWSSPMLVGGGEAPTIAVDASGVVHLVYSNYFTSTRYVTHAPGTGTWNSHQNVFNTFSWWPTLRINPLTNLPVVFSNPQDAYYSEYNGSTWASAFVSSDPGPGFGVQSHSLDVNRMTGQPSVVFSDASTQMRFAYRDDTGWHVEVPPFAAGGWPSGGIVLDSSGRPNIAYTYYTGASGPFDLRFARRLPDNAWETSLIAAASVFVNANNSKLALDSSDQPKIVFAKVVGSQTKPVLAETGGAVQDCNDNSISDDCDISCGIAGGPCDVPGCGQIPDCNSNGVPDSCDVASGTSSDCNGNGGPDQCDIDNDPSIDTDPQNGIIDVCECIDSIPPSGLLSSRLFGVSSGQWLQNNGGIWCPTLVPDNSLAYRFNVRIASQPPNVTVPSIILAMSPTIAALSLLDGAKLFVGSDSGATVRTLSVDNGITNFGVLRVQDGGRFIVDTPIIEQASSSTTQGDGVLEAADGNLQVGPRSRLQINGAVVHGGIARTIGTNSAIELLGSAEFVSVTIEHNANDVQTVVVPDQQVGRVSGQIQNNGLIQVLAGENVAWLQPGASGVVLSGDGSLELRATIPAGLAVFGQFQAGAQITNAADHMIHGEGLLFGRIVNYGTILADRDGSDLEISDPGSKENYGALVATSGGQLLIEDDIVGTGRLLAQGGTIQVSGGVLVVCDDIDVPPGSVSHLDIGVNPAGPAIVNAATLNIAGGIVTVNNGSTVNVTGAVTICPAVSPPGSVAELHVNQSTLNAGSLDICSGGVFTVASTISVGESFINAMTDGTSTPAPAHWSWAPGSDLVFTGGQAANMQPFVLDGWAILEVASADIGPTGGTNDFKLADLILATGTHVSLVDFKENHLPPVASEADYCDSLTLSSGAVLNLNGNALYVAGVPVAVGPFGGGLIVDEPRGIVGDCSGDGDLTYDDVTCFIDALLGVDLELSHQLAADLNRDGSTDGRDIRQFIEVVLSS